MLASEPSCLLCLCTNETDTAKSFWDCSSEIRVREWEEMTCILKNDELLASVFNSRLRKIVMNLDVKYYSVKGFNWTVRGDWCIIEIECCQLPAGSCSPPSRPIVLIQMARWRILWCCSLDAAQDQDASRQGETSQASCDSNRVPTVWERAINVCQWIDSEASVQWKQSLNAFKHVLMALHLYALILCRHALWWSIQ